MIGELKPGLKESELQRVILKALLIKTTSGDSVKMVSTERSIDDVEFVPGQDDLNLAKLNQFKHNAETEVLKQLYA